MSTSNSNSRSSNRRRRTIINQRPNQQTHLASNEINIYDESTSSDNSNESSKNKNISLDSTEDMTNTRRRAPLSNLQKRKSDKKYNQLLDASSSSETRFNTKKTGKSSIMDNESNFWTKKTQKKSKSKHWQNNQKKDEQMSESQKLFKEVRQILHQLQIINYEQRQFQDLKSQFSQCCQNHVFLSDYFPQSRDEHGKLLLKDGIFHEMWSKVLLKNPQIQKQACLSAYYGRFRQIVQENVSNFQTVFNPIPQQQPQKKRRSNQVSEDFKQYLKNINYNISGMIVNLYNEVKRQMGEQQKALEQKDKKEKANFNSCLQQWKQNIDAYREKQLQFTSKISQKCESFENLDENQLKRQLLIQQLKAKRHRSRSPLSQRFRFIHESQSNDRRAHAQMACQFCQINQFYFLHQLQIAKVQQVKFSPKHQLFVLKAYFVQFVPQQGKMRMQPKLKNLIGAYKYPGLFELIRLENTYGKFDGIIIYQQCFNIKAYIGGKKNNQVKLLRDQYLNQIRQQLEKEINAESERQQLKCQQGTLY